MKHIDEDGTITVLEWKNATMRWPANSSDAHATCTMTWPVAAEVHKVVSVSSVPQGGKV